MGWTTEVDKFRKAILDLGYSLGQDQTEFIATVCIVHMTGYKMEEMISHEIGPLTKIESLTT